MTTYQFAKKSCPYCEDAYTFSECSSYNTFGARYFSDGYVFGISEMGQRLYKCTTCERYLWLDEFIFEKSYGSRPPQIGILTRSFFSLDNSNATESEDGLAEKEEEYFPEISPLPFSKYLEVLKDEPWRNSKEEKFLRIGAWWAKHKRFQERTKKLRKLEDFLEEGFENTDLIQRHPGLYISTFQKKISFSGDEKDNLASLLSIFDANDEHDILLSAEIYRQLGEFQECIRKLQKVGSENLQNAKATIEGLAQKRIQGVSVISND